MLRAKPVLEALQAALKFLSGGELAAGVVIDSILRLLLGVLRADSTREESFS